MTPIEGEEPPHAYFHSGLHTTCSIGYDEVADGEHKETECLLHRRRYVDVMLDKLFPKHSHNRSEYDDTDWVDALEPGSRHFPVAYGAVALFVGKEGERRTCLLEGTPEEDYEDSDDVDDSDSHLLDCGESAVGNDEYWQSYGNSVDSC